MKFKEYGINAAVMRNCIKKNLEYEVTTGFDEREARVRKFYDIDDSLENSEFQTRLEIARKEKSCIEGLLRNEMLLNIYLDSEVRKNIIGFLKIIADGPNEESRVGIAIKAFKQMGFEDAEEYLSEFDSVEDVRKDLFEQAGLEYISYDTLCSDMEAAREAFDLDESALVKTKFEKAGIDVVAGNYSARDYFTYEVAMMPEEQAKLLAEVKAGRGK